MKKDRDIVFLSGLFPKELEDEIINNSIGSIQNAANVLQWNIVEGLELNIQKPINIINSLYIGSYPRRYKKAFIKTKKFREDKDSKSINVGFINILGIKHYSRYCSIKPYLKKWAIDNKKNKIIIAYAMTGVFMDALKYIKKINPNIKTCIIVPDLPQYMNLSKDKSRLYEILKSFEIKRIEKGLKYIDNFVLLTNEMSNVLNVDNYTVVEGISTDVFKDLNFTKKSSEDNLIKEILYTGSLNEKYGILNLVKAFRKIDNENYRLILCGHGDSVNKILEAQKCDDRIIFKGMIPRENVLKLQLNADVLINPRQNTEEYTKYSFPSKNLEYLSSGTPLIAYKLDGIPDEYDEYIHYVEDNSIDSLKEKIIEVCQMSNDELLEFGNKAKNFVLNYKNKEIQAKKIINNI